MNIYQHFRPEEREFIDQVVSLEGLCGTKLYT